MHCAMFLSRALCLTFVAFSSVFIAVNDNKVECAPVKAAFSSHAAKDTARLHSRTGGDGSTFHANGSKRLDLSKVSPEVVNGLIEAYEDDIEEGDILIQHYRLSVDTTWPTVNGKVSVPYVTDPKVDAKVEEIEEAMSMIENKTCVDFHKREHEHNYIEFQTRERGCASYVGMIGGLQELYVGDGCTVGNIAHELLHALGFHHEHSRMDRDKYIKIHYENIIEGKERNFRKLEGNTLGVPYDLGSILHYGNFHFSKGEPTVVAINDTDVVLGQRSHLSELDAQRINKLYNCDD
ncbi:astacin-like metalloendopeptidase [Engraulis encrasicolus]|uniref:astacin-like metalloendopeptidase n=1 Tax=Engraulis encrasicolus TaxID=184585 RepID=UPI002FCFC0F3